MNKQLFRRSPIAGKVLTGCALTLASLFLLPTLTNAQSVSFGLTFGNPLPNGGPCVGKGDCQDVFVFDANSNSYVSAPEAITVIFQVPPPSVNVVTPTPDTLTPSTDTLNTGVANIDSIVPVDTTTQTVNNPNVLMMIFSLSQLTQNQPGQVAYFTDSSHTYQFDSAYSLEKPIYAPLHLLPGAYIDPTDETNVTINGDQVVLTIYYSYSLSRANSGASLPATQTTASCTFGPNPATDIVTLNLNSNTNINRYSITNLVGQVVNENTISNTTQSINVSNLPTGMYLMNLYNGSAKTETLKFAKQ